MSLTAAVARLDRAAPPGPDAVFEDFAAWAAGQGLRLYPHQEEALIEIVSGANVILSTPTGSGKSLVATGAHFAALAERRRTFYTAPIKALVSEKFFALCDTFGPADVGMLTGDASVNADAPVICCTAEILANIALREGERADVGQVVMDEFHFYADPQRGWAWQVPLIELPRAQFLLMSATLGDVARFVDDLTRRTGRPTAVVRSAERPVPLLFHDAMTPLHETIEELLVTRQAPVYIVHFTQVAALERAQALTSINLATRAEKDQIAETIGNFRFTAGFGRTLSRLVRHGIGVHHAGMLPKYRRLVETLAQAGLLKVICGTDTLGVGINVPIRTVLFTGLSKFDGTKTRLLQAREFHQIAGRAGRAGFDTLGAVVVQAPEHVIDNERALAKAGDDERKRRRVVRKKPPEGSVGWGRPTFDRLVAAEPEALRSSFAVSHSMLLNVIARPGDAFAAMRHLLTDNHEDRPAQRRHIRRAIAIYRALLAGGVVERLPEPDAEGRRVRLTVDLQWDFALNQPLSPLALAAIELLGRESPTYALDVLSVIESTLDDPRQVLSAQQFKARGEAVAQMKADGIEYEQRMDLLDSVKYPKPLAELLDAAYQLYRQGHPWVADHQLEPKS
ncbi:MAG: DEAD/DEAH box helicase, partial [Micromonosporaceae bacterium]